ncbi:MAG: ABC transporter ATP-binding protein [Bacillota bacterium]|jgi:oligopeptide transport system ATP-binding protein
MDEILEVNDLKVSFFLPEGEIQAVRGVDFNLFQGEVLAIVGESGSGKSVTAQAIMRLLPEPPGKILNGKVLFQGVNLLQLSKKQMQKIRGQEIGMIFQDSATSLNPTMPIGKQIAEMLVFHRKISWKDVTSETIELMKMVGLSAPEERMGQYPHQLSGGMRQRIMIAIALAGNPKILIADEPTAALDATIQLQIMLLLKSIQEKTGIGIIIISHNLGVVADLAARIIVMYAGKIMELGPADKILLSPQHPYTFGLIKSWPRFGNTAGKKLFFMPGQPPDLLRPPQGCPFAPRCASSMVICHKIMPPMFHLNRNQRVACWLKHPQASLTGRRLNR